MSAKSRFAIVLLMLLSLGVPLCSMAEDIQETAYDESEAVPFVGTRAFSILVPTVAVARTGQHVLSSLNLETAVTSMFGPARVHEPNAHRSANARVILTLLCTLRF